MGINSFANQKKRNVRKINSDKRTNARRQKGIFNVNENNKSRKTPKQLRREKAKRDKKVEKKRFRKIKKSERRTKQRNRKMEVESDSEEQKMVVEK